MTRIVRSSGAQEEFASNRKRAHRKDEKSPRSAELRGFFTAGAKGAGPQRTDEARLRRRFGGLCCLWLPGGSSGLKADQLPCRLSAAGGVILQIAFFGLPLETLFLLKSPPLGAVLVTAAVEGGTGRLTGKHSRHSSFKNCWSECEFCCHYIPLPARPPPAAGKISVKLSLFCGKLQILRQTT